MSESLSPTASSPQPPSLSTTESRPALGPPRRRNGRQQACEPCRRRKVSCGHEIPVCHRCRRKGAARDCVYLIEGRPADFGASRLQSATSSSTAPDDDLANSERRATTAQGMQRDLDDTTPASCSAPSPPLRNPGYLGATSFSAVFEEAQNSLASIQGRTAPSTPGLGLGGIPMTSTGAEAVSTSRETSAQAQRLIQSLATGSHAMTTSPVRAKAIEILQLIPEERIAKHLFRRYINPNDGWIRRGSERIIQSLYSHFGPQLRRGNTAGLREMAALLSSNCDQPLDEDMTDPTEWLESFSGPNMRWESLAVLFTFWACGSMNSPEAEWCDLGASLELTWPDLLQDHRRYLLVRYKEAAWDCIRMADPGSRNANSLMVYAMYKHSILESNVSGDASLALWKLHAQLVGVTTFLGLHAESAHTPAQPTAASEARRRCFAVVFNIDKISATFTGRPPLISRRYASTPLPLDLGNDVLMSDQETIARAVAQLDENGWNTTGRILSTTILRARTILARNLDGILEAALGVTQEASVEHLLHLRTLELDAIAKFPSALHYTPDDLKMLTQPGVDTLLSRDFLSEGPANLYAKVLTRLCHLQNMFFLERLLAKKTQRDPRWTRALLATSVEMVTLTLVFWTHKDRLYAMHGDFEWLVMSYAAPAGGVLCMELMNPGQAALDLPEQYRADKERDRATEGSRDPGVGIEPQQLSRSNIIQQLSLLVGFLGWVGPAAPNGDLCETVKGIIQRVLDYTLNNLAGSPAGQTVTGNLAGAGFQVDVNDMQFFNFDLLDTFDWLRPGEAGLGYDAMQHP